MQSHTLTNTRLALGYSAFALCAATFYWDYTYGFESTKLYTALAVALYTVLNGALTFWIFYIEAGTIYSGASPTGDTITIATKTDKHIPIYNMTITTYWKGGSKPEVVKLKLPFTKWFDREGHFVSLPFQQVLASNVPLVGASDPERVVEEVKKKVIRAEGEEGESKSMEEKWASLLAESTAAEGASNGTPKAKKRGKKA